MDECEITINPTTDKLSAAVAAALGDHGTAREVEIKHYDLEETYHLALVVLLAREAVKSIAPVLCEHIRQTRTPIRAKWAEGGDMRSVTASTVDEFNAVVDTIRKHPPGSTNGKKQR